MHMDMYTSIYYLVLSVITFKYYQKDVGMHVGMLSDFFK